MEAGCRKQHCHEKNISKCDKKAPIVYKEKIPCGISFLMINIDVTILKAQKIGLADYNNDIGHANNF